jgi:RNA polymerase sigma-70 factor (ECF subfamily)
MVGQAVTPARSVRIARSEEHVQAVLSHVELLVNTAETSAPEVSEAAADAAMDRYADGDDGAFAVIYDALEGRLRRHAFWWTGSVAAADDAVQQTFLAIHGARDRFVRGAPVRPWAYAILRRFLIDAARRACREELHGHGALEPIGSEVIPVDEQLIHREEQARLLRALEALPMKLREAFVLVKLEGLSVQEAADVLGIKPGNVRVRVCRAREALDLARSKDSPAEADAAAPAPDSVPT